MAVVGVACRTWTKTIVSKIKLFKLLADKSPHFNARAEASSSTSFDAYTSVFNDAVKRPEEFWASAADNLHWFKKWDVVLDQSNTPLNRWFVGGELNTCFNALDRHVESGRGQQLAIIHDSPVTSSVRKITYSELLRLVKDFAGALTTLGVKRGDRILIYMPMIPEAVISMLASARIGAIHSLVFGGFAAKELSTRIAHCEPTVVVSANCGVEPSRIVSYKPLLDQALHMIDFKPKKCIIFNRPQFEPAVLQKDRDLEWSAAISMSRPVDCVPVAATDPTYILYTSGTTGLPKAVVRPSGGHAVALNWSMWNVYGLTPGEVWWAASDLGWVVGHSYIVYAPLLSGCTSILYEGKPVGTPDPGAFFRVLHEHQVQAMFVAPTAIRSIRAEDPDGEFAQPYLPLDKLQALYVAGEHCDHETMQWIQQLIKKPILDNWWQTVHVLKPDGKATKDGELGQIYVKQPLPPGFMSTLYKADQQFKEIYFSKMPGYYDTMDSGIRNENGYISVLSRSDDVINVAGHRLSCGSIEEAILVCQEIVEAAVVGIPDKLKGSVPLGLCVIKHGCTKSEAEIQAEVIQLVRKEVGPVAAFKLVVIVPKLPKTRSGKVARNTLAAMAVGQPYKIPVTIDDPNVYPAIQECLQAMGLGLTPK